MSEVLPESQCWTIPSEGPPLQLKFTKNNNIAIYDTFLKPTTMLAPGSNSDQKKDDRFYGELKLRIRNREEIKLRAGLFTDATAYPQGRCPHTARRALMYTLLILPTEGTQTLKNFLEQNYGTAARSGCAAIEGCREDQGNEGYCVKLSNMTITDVGSIASFRTIIEMHATMDILSGPGAPLGLIEAAPSTVESPEAFRFQVCRNLLCGKMVGENKKTCSEKSEGDWDFWSRLYLLRCEQSFAGKEERTKLVTCLNQHMQAINKSKRDFRPEELNEWKRDYLRPILATFEKAFKLYARSSDSRQLLPELREDLNTMLLVYDTIVKEPKIQLEENQEKQPRLKISASVVKAANEILREKRYELKAQKCDDNAKATCIFFEAKTIEDPAEGAREARMKNFQDKIRQRSQRTLARKKPDVEERGASSSKRGPAATVEAGREREKDADEILARKVRRLKQERQLATFLLDDVTDTRFDNFTKYVREYFKESIVEELQKLKASLDSKTGTLEHEIESGLAALEYTRAPERKKIQALTRYPDDHTSLLNMTKQLLKEMTRLEAQPRLEDKQGAIKSIRTVVGEIKKIEGNDAIKLKKIATSVEKYLNSLERQREPELHVVYVEYIPSALDMVHRNLAKGSAPTAIKDAWAKLREQDQDLVLAADRWSTTDPGISSVRRCLDAIWTTELGDFKLGT